MLRLFILVCLSLGLAPALPAIVNGDFETGDLTGWTVSYGPSNYGNSAATIVSAGFAPNTNNNLNVVDQGNYACHLTSGTGGAGDTYVRISQNQFISAGNTILSFRYAAVLSGAHSSTPTDDASMSVSLTAGSATVYTATYRYASSPAPLVNDGVSSYRHLPWTTINVDLSAYAGQTITVTFEARDCLYGGHGTDAYVDGFSFIPPTPSVTPTSTISPSFTVSPTLTPSPTPSFSPTRTPSFTVSPTFTISYTPTITPSFTQSMTHTITPTFSVTPTVTPTPTATPPRLTLALYPPNPNPSHEEVWLPYVLGTPADVDVKIWTVAGELVRAWPEGFHDMGANEAHWDHRNEAGSKVGSGIFLYRIRARSPAGELREEFGKCAVSR